jgi:hypothetical protein
LRHVQHYAHRDVHVVSVVGISAFQLSRIYSQGWNAAKKLVANGAVDADAKTAAALNPYRATRTAGERARWAKGFTDALQSTAVPFNAASGSFRRPAG